MQCQQKLEACTVKEQSTSILEEQLNLTLMTGIQELIPNFKSLNLTYAILASGVELCNIKTLTAQQLDFQTTVEFKITKANTTVRTLTT